MSVLSKNFLMEIERVLKTRNFLYEDFQIEISDDFNYVTLNIKYLYMENFIFKGTIFKSGESFHTEITPGSIVSTEKHNGLDKDDFFNSLRKWLLNISNELKADPLIRQLNKHEEILKQFQSKISELEDGNDLFTDQENGDLRSRLDALEKAFSEKLESDIDDKDKLSKEITKLHSEIELLKNQLDAFSKKNWFLSLSTRIFSWIKRNPNTARQLAGYTRELLPDEAKTFISEDAIDILLPQQEISSK